MTVERALWLACGSRSVAERSRGPFVEPIGADLARSNHDATVHMVDQVLGWVTDSTAFLAALAALFMYSAWL